MHEFKSGAIVVFSAFLLAFIVSLIFGWIAPTFRWVGPVMVVIAGLTVVVFSLKVLGGQTVNLVDALKPIFASEIFRKALKASLKIALTIGVSAILLSIYREYVPQAVDYLSCDFWNLDARLSIIILSFLTSSAIVAVLSLFIWTGLTPEFVKHYSTMLYKITFLVALGIGISLIQLPNKFYDRNTGLPKVAISEDGERMYYCAEYDDKGQLINPYDDEGQKLRKPSKPDIEKFGWHPKGWLKNILHPVTELGGIMGNYLESELIIQKKKSEKALSEARAYDAYAPEPKNPKKKEQEEKPVEKKNTLPNGSTLLGGQEIGIVAPAENVYLKPGKVAFHWTGSGIGSREIVDLHYSLPDPSGDFATAPWYFCGGYYFQSGSGVCNIPYSAVGKSIKIFAGIRPAKKGARYLTGTYAFYQVR